MHFLRDERQNSRVFGFCAIRRPTNRPLNSRRVRAPCGKHQRSGFCNRVFFVFFGWFYKNGSKCHVPRMSRAPNVTCPECFTDTGLGTPLMRALHDATLKGQTAAAMLPRHGQEQLRPGGHPRASTTGKPLDMPSAPHGIARRMRQGASERGDITDSLGRDDGGWSPLGSPLGTSSDAPLSMGMEVCGDWAVGRWGGS